MRRRSFLQGVFGSAVALPLAKVASMAAPTGFATACLDTLPSEAVVFTTPGAYTFTVPSGVASVTHIIIGAGEDGDPSTRPTI